MSSEEETIEHLSTNTKRKFSSEEEHYEKKAKHFTSDDGRSASECENVSLKSSKKKLDTNGKDRELLKIKHRLSKHRNKINPSLSSSDEDLVDIGQQTVSKVNFKKLNSKLVPHLNKKKEESTGNTSENSANSDDEPLMSSKPETERKPLANDKILELLNSSNSDACEQKKSSVGLGKGAKLKKQSDCIDKSKQCDINNSVSEHSDNEEIPKQKIEKNKSCHKTSDAEDSCSEVPIVASKAKNILSSQENINKTKSNNSDNPICSGDSSEEELEKQKTSKRKQKSKLSSNSDSDDEPLSRVNNQNSELTVMHNKDSSSDDEKGKNSYEKSVNLKNLTNRAKILGSNAKTKLLNGKSIHRETYISTGKSKSTVKKSYDNDSSSGSEPLETSKSKQKNANIEPAHNRSDSESFKSDVSSNNKMVSKFKTSKLSSTSKKSYGRDNSSDSEPLATLKSKKKSAKTGNESDSEGSKFDVSMKGNNVKKTVKKSYDSDDSSDSEPLVTSKSKKENAKTSSESDSEDSKSDVSIKRNSSSKAGKKSNDSDNEPLATSKSKQKSTKIISAANGSDSECSKSDVSIKRNSSSRDDKKSNDSDSEPLKTSKSKKKNVKIVSAYNRSDSEGSKSDVSVKGNNVKTAAKKRYDSDDSSDCETLTIKKSKKKNTRTGNKSDSEDSKSDVSIERNKTNAGSRTSKVSGIANKKTSSEDSSGETSNESKINQKPNTVKIKKLKTAAKLSRKIEKPVSSSDSSDDEPLLKTNASKKPDLNVLFNGYSESEKCNFKTRIKENNMSDNSDQSSKQQSKAKFIKEEESSNMVKKTYKQKTVDGKLKKGTNTEGTEAKSIKKEVVSDDSSNSGSKHMPLSNNTKPNSKVLIKGGKQKKVNVKKEKHTSSDSEPNTHKKEEKMNTCTLKKAELSDSVSESSKSEVDTDEGKLKKSKHKLSKVKNHKSTKSYSNDESSDYDKKGVSRTTTIKHEMSASDSDSDSSHSAKQNKSDLKNASEKIKKRTEHTDSDSSQTTVQKKSKKGPEENKRIINLKKYLHVAGIRTKNYAELWKGCRSNKARADKLHELLEKNGLKGRPTIEKCKKLRIKIETKKEIAELDLGNIMDDGERRSRRSRGGSMGTGVSRLSGVAVERAAELKQHFSRIKALNSSSSESD